MLAAEAFTLEFDGGALRSGDMDIADLAPALLAVSHLCSEANATLNKNQVAISVRVKAEFKRGSFGIDLQIVQTAFDQIKHLFVTHQFKDVKEILDTLGVLADDTKKIGEVAGIPLLGLLWIAKNVANRKSDVVARSESSVTINISGNTFVVNSTAWELYQRPAIREDLARLTDPLRRDGIDILRFKKDGHTTQSITKSDASQFTQESADEIAFDAMESVRIFSLRRPSFDPDLVWSFYEGENNVSASMKDDEFLGKVRSHEVVFGDGDILKVSLRSTTRRTSGGSLKIAHEITKVLEFWSQGKLPFPPSTPPSNASPPAQPA